MAERRMFSKSIIDSDVFLDMPLSAQALYFHLSMRADDDGFLGNAKRIRSIVGASEDDLKLLIVKGFVLTFDSGVIVIKHWRLHNYIQADRYKPSVFVEEKMMLSVDDNKIYDVNLLPQNSCIQSVSNMDTQCIQPVSNLYPQVRLEIGKDRVDNKRKNESINNCNSNNAHACTREMKTYDDILDDLEVEKEVRPSVLQFIKHCSLNGRKLIDSKLTNILVYMDMHCYSPKDKIDALQAAINGGYYDIKRE